MGWRMVALLPLVLLSMAVMACWGGDNELTSPSGGSTSLSPFRTVEPFLAGTRPVFPTDTPAPTATPLRLEPTLEPRIVPVGVGTVGVSSNATPAATAQLEACPTGVIGATGVSVVEEAFFASESVENPHAWPGLESDFYVAHDLVWLVWALRFDVPDELGSVEISYRWGRMLSDGRARLIAVVDWDPLMSDGFNIRIAGMGGETAGFWRPGRYFVDAWSPDHDCAVTSWFFEVH